ncbi:2903_t:CDS:2, partial [Acaulospora colombiana]
PGQVREFLTAMAKSPGVPTLWDTSRSQGLVGGIYLWINRSNGYLSLSNLHGIIGNALIKYGLGAFVLVLFFVPNATSSLVLACPGPSGAGDEAKEKMSAARKGMKFSEEHKIRINEA